MIEDFNSWSHSNQFKITPDGAIGDDGGTKTPPQHAGDRMEFGEFTWANYEFACRIQIFSGIMAQLHYRLPPERREWYTVDLRIADQKVSISRGGKSMKILEQVDFPLQYRTEYDVKVIAQYSSLTAFIDGKQLLQASETSKPLLTGQVGLAIWQCRALFRDPRLSLIG